MVREEGEFEPLGMGGMLSMLLVQKLWSVWHTPEKCLRIAANGSFWYKRSALVKFFRSVKGDHWETLQSSKPICVYKSGTLMGVSRTGQANHWNTAIRLPGLTTTTRQAPPRHTPVLRDNRLQHPVSMENRYRERGEMSI